MHVDEVFLGGKRIEVHWDTQRRNERQTKQFFLQGKLEQLQKDKLLEQNVKWNTMLLCFYNHCTLT